MTDSWLGEVIGRIGYDCVWLDMEHRAFGYDVVRSDVAGVPAHLHRSDGQIDVRVPICRGMFAAISHQNSPAR